MEEFRVKIGQTIPNKIFFKIGEVAEITQLEPYVLRYWENEFNFKLNKTNHKQRLYQRKDINEILLVKKLLYDDKFTIAGAKKKIKEIKKKQRQNQLSLVYDVPKDKVLANKNNKNINDTTIKKPNSGILAIKRELNAILDELKLFK
ncbi:MAG TPA: MerR family transcriptional regulator [Oligoflexia bacterium]|nr:MerR family transcriptional regulator [Oligoflexia bacterium]HMR24105.1 MerR family transcriptional regulator [Oligoflexia bacterium]